MLHICYSGNLEYSGKVACLYNDWKCQMQKRWKGSESYTKTEECHWEDKSRNTMYSEGHCINTPAW